jgi:septal ring factor EnvC (AmiA/AmiB activator)
MCRASTPWLRKKGVDGRDKPGHDEILIYCHLENASTMKRSVAAIALALAAMLSPPAIAQDIRGLEVCTAEKQMERRTGCLQANVELLQQALTRLSRETQDKIAAAGRDLAAARAEIAALQSALARLNSELAQMKTKIDASSKK